MSDSPLRESIVKALRSVHDPEIPVNLYDLGLVYALDVSDDGDVAIQMTLTTPNCPVADMLPAQVKQAVEVVPGVRSANVEIVWEPTWTPAKMSERARAEMELRGITVPDHSDGPRTTKLTFGRTNRPR
jgi:FeS assembly SUF system protein